MKRRIRIRGINGDIEGKIWESESLLRAGRLATLEMVLDDTSVSRRHAEIRSTPQGWRVRDLGSTNGTFLNGSRLEAGEWPLRPNDIIRCGNITLVVDFPGSEKAHNDEDCPRPDKVAGRGLRQLVGRRLAGDRLRPQSQPAARRTAAGPAAGRPSPGSPRKRRRPAAHHPQRCRQHAGRPARRHRSGRGTDRAAQACGPWPAGSSRCRRGTGFSQNLAQRSFMPRRIDPVQQRR